MSHATDITGQVFGRLTVVCRNGSDKHKKALWLCKCECGEERSIATGSLKSGNTTSCGCLHKEDASKRFKKHGYTGSKIYAVWKAMINRCRNPNDKDYHHYGGRGIHVCESWLTFENFLNDMGEPIGKFELDRIDNSSGYSKSNCKWSTRSEQMKNTRRSKC